MNLIVSQNEQNRISTRAEVVCMLQNAQSQVRAIALLVESDAYCPEILWSLYEVQRVMCCVVGRLAADEIERCFSVAIESPDLFRQHHALADVVTLYTFICRQQPQLISGKEVSGQHK